MGVSLACGRTHSLTGADYFVPAETCFTDFISFGLCGIMLTVLTAILLCLNASSDSITENPGMLEAGTRGTCQFEFQLGLPIETLS